MGTTCTRKPLQFRQGRQPDEIKVFLFACTFSMETKGDFEFHQDEHSYVEFGTFYCKQSKRINLVEHSVKKKTKRLTGLKGSYTNTVKTRNPLRREDLDGHSFDQNFSCIVDFQKTDSIETEQKKCQTRFSKPTWTSRR